MDQRLEISSSRILRYLSRLKGMHRGKEASGIRREVQAITSQCASVVRTEEGLKKGIRALEELEKEEIAFDDKGIVFALETENLVQVAQMILRACLRRKESRGPHLFFSGVDDPEPLPSKDPGWRRYIVIQNQKGKMVLRKKTPMKLRG